METPESETIHCQYFVKRKKRFCRMTIKKGFEYCGEHQPSEKMEMIESNANGYANTGIRIDCPYDNKHTCFAHKLEKHLKRCNAQPKTSEAYIFKGINAGDEELLINAENKEIRLLSKVPVEEIKNVISKINKIYEDVIAPNISTLYLKHEIVEQELLKPEHGDKSKKHLIQTSAILGLLNKYKLLQDNVSFVEFGAGKGQVSYWLAKATENLLNSSVILIERASLRHKLDNKLEKDFNVERVRADIADLYLKKVEKIRKNIVGITKHLCGDATDLAMRCLRNFQQYDSDSTIKGLVMSFCCHHRCQWVSYCGKDFLKLNNLCQSDFDTMCGLVSWAVCGTGRSRSTTKSAKELPLNDRDIVLGLNRHEKEEIGRRSKMVLNYGRLKYLENEMSLNCKLHYYVGREISLENVCVVAINTNP